MSHLVNLDWMLLHWMVFPGLLSLTRLSECFEAIWSHCRAQLYRLPFWCLCGIFFIHLGSFYLFEPIVAFKLGLPPLIHLLLSKWLFMSLIPFFTPCYCLWLTSIFVISAHPLSPSFCSRIPVLCCFNLLQLPAIPCHLSLVNWNESVWIFYPFPCLICYFSSRLSQQLPI